MYNFFAISIGKIVMKVMKILKFNSTVFPGYLVLNFFPKLLNKIKYPNLIIIVTGSSGKGSTVNLITKVLRDNGYKVTNNEKGSNLINAFATMIIKDSNLKGNVLTDAIVYEADERYLKIITKYIKPNYLIINNITRDQPPRQGHFDIVFDEIRKGIDNSTHLIINGDDPFTKKFELIHKGKITYYGIDKNFMSFKENINSIKDSSYCPKCNSKLIYNFYHYGSIGNFKCPNCNFKRDNLSYKITKIDRENMKITINKKYDISIDNYILFNLYNICSCFCLCDLLKINKKNIIESLNNISLNEKIYNEFNFKNRKYIVLNCKAENNATYNLSLIYTALDTNKKTIVLGLGEISRRYKHFDLSWLWDINFELLSDNNVDKFICVGPYRYDIATRIKYTGIDEKNIIILKNIDKIYTTIKNKTKGNVYGILNFDYLNPFIKSIKEEK